MIAYSLERIQAPGGGTVVYNPGFEFIAMTVITVTAGTMFVMWIGEQITERGVGNGISLIIMSGIIARLPSAIGTTVQFVREGEMSIFLLILIFVVAFGVIGGDRLRRERSAPDSGAICAACGRTAGLWRTGVTSSAEGEYLGSYSADFRVVDPDFSGHDRRL